VAKLLASNSSMSRTPETPALMLSQDSFTVLPTGETKPNPVTTTRRCDTRFPKFSQSRFRRWLWHTTVSKPM